MNKSTAESHDSPPHSPALTELIGLFSECRTFEANHDIVSARKIERKVAKLVAEIAASQPNSEEHADALAYHEYTLLSLARTSKRSLVAKSLRDAAYAKGAAAVAIRLKSLKPDLGTVFAAYNLAIDLIVSEKRTEDGLQWMLQARTLLTKLAGKKKLPTNLLEIKLYSIDYGIAQAYYDQGRAKAAKTMLKRALNHAPKLSTARWSALRGVAKCAELLAQIQLDELDAKRKDS